MSIDLAFLPSWVAEQIANGEGQRANLTGIRGDAMYVLGSLGVDAVLTSLGEIWLAEYDLETVDEGAVAPTWRRAEGVERTGYLVAAARRFVELRALLPERSAAATSCPNCRGTGDWHVFSADRRESLRISGVTCKTCGGLGWQ